MTFADDRRGAGPAGQTSKGSPRYFSASNCCLDHVY